MLYVFPLLSRTLPFLSSYIWTTESYRIPFDFLECHTTCKGLCAPSFLLRTYFTTIRLLPVGIVRPLIQLDELNGHSRVNSSELLLPSTPRMSMKFLSQLSDLLNPRSLTCSSIKPPSWDLIVHLHTNWPLFSVCLFTVSSPFEPLKASPQTVKKNCFNKNNASKDSNNSTNIKTYLKYISNIQTYLKLAENKWIFSKQQKDTWNNC